ncbi:MAG: hypothetical protein M1833_005970 [Piccolia ochrophora]|nr:MAG: hypothetical protein M1833_005970 [Piccolia ochrophora]
MLALPDEDEEAQLQLAIALSMEDSKPPVVVDLCTDEDGSAGPVADSLQKDTLDEEVLTAEDVPTSTLDLEDIRRPEHKSVGIFGKRNGWPGNAVDSSVHLNLDLTTKSSSNPPTSKRKASISPPQIKRKGPEPDDSARKRLETASSRVLVDESPHRSLTTSASPLKTEEDDKAPAPNISSGNFSGAERDLEYPRGVVKKTWAFGVPRKDDVKLEEVLQKHDLTTAVLSSYQWDPDWLMQKLDLQKTKLIFVMQAKDDNTKNQYRRETAGLSNLRLCFPPMEGNVNCMHSKLQLLFHPNYLRLVVPTANLVPFDWGESGVMENMVFLMDLPRLKPKSPVADLTLFKKELIRFLEANQLGDDVIRGVQNFDFSETKDMAFVHTIGGSHTGEAWRHTGYCGLGATIKSLGLHHRGPLQLDYVVILTLPEGLFLQW